MRRYNPLLLAQLEVQQHASSTALARRLRLPQILCVHDDHCNMRNAAAPDDMTYTGPVRSQANIAGVEGIHEMIAAGFHLQLTGQEEGEVIDDLSPDPGFDTNPALAWAA